MACSKIARYFYRAGRRILITSPKIETRGRATFRKHYHWLEGIVYIIPASGGGISQCGLPRSSGCLAYVCFFWRSVQDRKQSTTKQNQKFHHHSFQKKIGFISIN